MPKLKVDQKAITELPASTAFSKLHVVYEDDELIQYVDERGFTNTARLPVKYLPKTIVPDADKYCQVDGGPHAVYEWPDASGSVVDQVDSNELVTIVQEFKYFVKINTPRNKDGWVERTALSDYLLTKRSDTNSSVMLNGASLVVKDKAGTIVRKEPVREQVTRPISSAGDIKNVLDAYDPAIYRKAQDKIARTMQSNQVSSLVVEMSRRTTKNNLTYYYNLDLKLFTGAKNEVYHGEFAGVCNAAGDNVISFAGTIPGMASYAYDGYVYNMLTAELSREPPAGWILTDGGPLPWTQIYREGMLIFSSQDSSEYQYSYIPYMQMALITHHIGLKAIVDYLYDPIRKQKVFAVTNTSESLTHDYIRYDQFGNISKLVTTSRLNMYGGRGVVAENTNYILNVYSNEYRK
ncbi:MAG: SH3 domain-containing protein [Spirochaetes bacterium]|nr:SH3 domain-containing protein [Spirochaetota bacterium]